MTTATESMTRIPWWKEPTKDQWLAWIAVWLGWTLDAFDFTVSLLIMVPISREFHVPLTAVAVVLPSPCGCAWWARPLLAGSPIESGARRR
jgi:MFS transporter, SHS family, lactate transporter